MTDPRPPETLVLVSSMGGVQRIRHHGRFYGAAIAHSIASFVGNTVLVAPAVNVAVALAR